MNKGIFSFFILAFFVCVSTFANNVYFRVNQLGYLEDDIKVAVAMFPNEEDDISQHSTTSITLLNGTSISIDSVKNLKSFSIINLLNGDIKDVDSVKITQPWNTMKKCVRIYFSSLKDFIKIAPI